MKKMLVKVAATLALIGGLVAVGAAPAEAATANRYAYCGAGYGAITVSNYSSINMSVAAYNASTGAYIATIVVNGGQSKNWLTAVHNVRFYLSGVSFGANTWCS